VVSHLGTHMVSTPFLTWTTLWITALRLYFHFPLYAFFLSSQRPRLNYCLTQDMMGSHQQYMSSLPPTQHPYSTSDRYPDGFPVMAALGDTLDEKYERGSVYSSDFGNSDVGSSSNPHPTRSEYETEKFLREHLSIPEPTPLNLDAIAHERRPGIKAMIILSIWASPRKRLTLQGIYEAIETRFPHRKSANDKPWQVSRRFASANT